MSTTSTSTDPDPEFDALLDRLGFTEEEHPAVTALERLDHDNQALVLHYVIGAAWRHPSWYSEFMEIVEYAANDLVQRGQR